MYRYIQANSIKKMCVCSCVLRGVFFRSYPKIASKRAMPEIGNEDAISSCGGAEWGEDVAYVEDEILRVLRGSGEDKTVTPAGSFSAGSRTLRSSSTTDASANDAQETTAVQHCLADPSTGRRVRVIQRVASSSSSSSSSSAAAAGGGGGGGGGLWETVSVDVWIEQKKTCVAPFSGEGRVTTDTLDDEAWEVVSDKTAAYDLEWPETPMPDAKDGGSTFVVAAAADAGGRTLGAAGDGAAGSARGNLSRLPCGVWVRTRNVFIIMYLYMFFCFFPSDT